jgi:hypothetical protein
MGAAIKEDCKRIMIASEDPDVLAAAKDYAENFMLSTNPFLSMVPKNYKTPDVNKTKVFTFPSRKAMDDFAIVDERDNCFGLYFKKVDKANFDYEVMFSFSKFRTIDTNKPLITPLISKPDLDSWNN